MSKIKVAGIDPALKNFGIAKAFVDLDTLEVEIDSLKLIQTERKVSKQVRQNSDDLRRATEISDEYRRYVKDCTVVFAEIPTGGQSADAVKSFGISIGLLAACPVPLIQVQPSETKLAAVGTKTASKAEMIEWAEEAYPNAPWLRRKSAGKLVMMNDNEHLADATAVIHAGLRTDEFKRLLAMLKVTR